MDKGKKKRKQMIEDYKIVYRDTEKDRENFKAVFRSEEFKNIIKHILIKY
ncbi:hypothetical protein ABET51_06810 [Metabacillus fastidiosus]